MIKYYFNKADINNPILLYIFLIYKSKKKKINFYYQIKLTFLWDINIIKFYKQLIFIYFIYITMFCKNYFRKKFNL